MKQLTCELCGSTDLVKSEGVFVCQSCGTKYSVEEAKKMLIEGTVSVQGIMKIDSSGQIQNLMILAERDVNNDVWQYKYDSAREYYKKIIEIDANYAPALFGLKFLKPSLIKVYPVIFESIYSDKPMESFETLLSETIDSSSLSKEQKIEHRLKGILYFCRIVFRHSDVLSAGAHDWLTRGESKKLVYKFAPNIVNIFEKSIQLIEDMPMENQKEKLESQIVINRYIIDFFEKKTDQRVMPQELKESSCKKALNELIRLKDSLENIDVVSS